MLEHGGRVRAAARTYGIPEADWLDLSTGINPHAYPVPAISPEDWQRLPEDDDGLLAAAAAYYGTPRLVAQAGSQPAIQALPRLLPRCRVGVLAPTYAEHPYRWQHAGHVVARVAATELRAAAEAYDTLVLCQPNNPDAATVAPEMLVDAAGRLAARGGHLVVDEAFVDPLPAASVTALAGGRLPGLIVLRSLGKFFGLAGARVGFVAGAPAILAALAEAAGPWPVSGPARRVATAALVDTTWQRAMRVTLTEASIRLAGLLAPLDPAGSRSVHPLFVWLPTRRAAAIATALARQGVLVRCFETPECVGLRFGLPGREDDWRRLADALAIVSRGERPDCTAHRVMEPR